LFVFFRNTTVIGIFAIPGSHNRWQGIFCGEKSQASMISVETGKRSGSTQESIQAFVANVTFGRQLASCRAEFLP